MASPYTMRDRGLAYGPGDFAQQPRSPSDLDLEASYTPSLRIIYGHSKRAILRHRLGRRFRRFFDPETRTVEKIDLKMRHPGSTKAINYNTSIPQVASRFVYRYFCLIAWMVLISFFHMDAGLQCSAASTGFDGVPMVPGLPSDGTSAPPDPVDLDYPPAKGEDQLKTPIVLYAEWFIVGGTVFLMANGQLSIRGAREKMVRVQHHATTVAYCLFKTTRESPEGYNAEELQHLIYECLFLITAYPVTLLHQMDGNTCEPDVTRYCHEVAHEFQRMRMGLVDRSSGHKLSTVRQPLDPDRFQFVDHYFEAFALKLDKEFRTQRLRKEAPSSLPQKIISNIRSHHQNLVDHGNLHDRNVAILRENIDAFSAFGRECETHSFTDIVPIVFLWVIHLSCWIMVIVLPIKHCEMLINSTGPHITAHDIPTLATLLTMFCVAIPGPVMFMLTDEMWAIWNPYRLGINVHSWILGIAREMDLLVNDFYEPEPVRPHSYAMDRRGAEHEHEMEQSEFHRLQQGLYASSVVERDGSRGFVSL